jgi:hypothetical protein
VQRNLKFGRRLESDEDRRVTSASSGSKERSQGVPVESRADGAKAGEPKDRVRRETATETVVLGEHERHRERRLPVATVEVVVGQQENVGRRRTGATGLIKLLFLVTDASAAEIS